MIHFWLASLACRKNRWIPVGFAGFPSENVDWRRFLPGTHVQLALPSESWKNLSRFSGKSCSSETLAIFWTSSMRSESISMFLIDFHVQNLSRWLPRNVFSSFGFSIPRNDQTRRVQKFFAGCSCYNPRNHFPTHSDFIDRPKKPGRVRSSDVAIRWEMVRFVS